ncbi:hypothetical protein EDB80DRAFT_739378, partial [Ilyonectria destructans]
MSASPSPSSGVAPLAGTLLVGIFPFARGFSPHLTTTACRRTQRPKTRAHPTPKLQGTALIHCCAKQLVKHWPSRRLFAA